MGDQLRTTAGPSGTFLKNPGWSPKEPCYPYPEGRIDHVRSPTWTIRRGEITTFFAFFTGMMMPGFGFLAFHEHYVNENQSQRMAEFKNTGTGKHEDLSGEEAARRGKTWNNDGRGTRKETRRETQSERDESTTT